MVSQDPSQPEMPFDADGGAGRPARPTFSGAYQAAMQPTPPPQAGRRGGGTLAVLAAVFIAGIAAAILLLWQWPTWFPGSAPAAQVADKLPVVVVPAGDAPGPARPAVIDLKTLSEQEAALAQRLTDLEARTARISGDADAAGTMAVRAENIMVAGAVRRAVERGQPLGYLEAQLRQRFGAAQPGAVATIIEASAQPVTTATLRAGLETIAPQLTTGAAKEGLLASLGRELGNLIVIHRADAPSPLPAERLARARQAIDTGQIDAAIAEVERMPGAAGASGWLAAAKRHIAARAALDTLEAAALSAPAAAPALANLPPAASPPPAPR